jgi:hypothetical protein
MRQVIVIPDVEDGGYYSAKPSRLLQPGRNG